MLEGWGEMGIVLDIMGQQRVTHGGDMERVQEEGVVLVVGMVKVRSRHHYSQLGMFVVGRPDTN